MEGQGKDCEKEKTPPPVADEDEDSSDQDQDIGYERDSVDSLLTESSSSDSGRAAERSPPLPGHKRGRKRRLTPPLPPSPTPRCIRGWPWGCPRSCPLSVSHEDLMKRALLDQEEPLEVDIVGAGPAPQLPQVDGEGLHHTEAHEGDQDQVPGHPALDFVTLEEGSLTDSHEELALELEGPVHDPDKLDIEEDSSIGE